MSDQVLCNERNSFPQRPPAAAEEAHVPCQKNARKAPATRDIFLVMFRLLEKHLDSLIIGYIIEIYAPLLRVPFHGLTGERIFAFR